MAGASSDQAKTSERLLSLDVYRGLVMLLLATNGLGIATAIRKAGAEGSIAQFFYFLGTHPKWESQFYVFGVSPWDLIQPAFMFIVGVSMPFSYEKRAKLGQSYGQRMRHAWTRAVLLTLLGVFLQSRNQPETNWLFTNVLSQIGLGYGFLFLMVGRSFRVQVLTGAAVLTGYYLLMILLPRGLATYEAHFADGTTFPQQFDLWFLNLFPRVKEFTGHAYSTLNFVPSFVTMLMGLMCGQVMKDERVRPRFKLRRLLVAAALLLVTGAILGLTICPVVKKLWTPSWTLYSGGYVIALLALSYWIIDVRKWQGWIFPIIVVGLNPLAMYLLGMLAKGPTLAAMKRHLPDAIFTAGPYSPVVEACLLAAVFWLILWWMYRNRVFLRL